MLPLAFLNFVKRIFFGSYQFYGEGGGGGERAGDRERRMSLLKFIFNFVKMIFSGWLFISVAVH